jgi:hypothetical protein
MVGHITIRSTIRISAAQYADYSSKHLVWCPGQCRRRLHEGDVAVDMAEREQHPSVLIMREKSRTAMD